MVFVCNTVEFNRNSRCSFTFEIIILDIQNNIFGEINILQSTG